MLDFVAVSMAASGSCGRSPQVNHTVLGPLGVKTPEVSMMLTVIHVTTHIADCGDAFSLDPSFGATLHVGHAGVSQQVYTAQRIMGMVHAAMFDAINSISTSKWASAASVSRPGGG
jgi:hypothetical protein